jgi:hypothetical protein
MTENKKIEIENKTETTTSKPKQSRFKKWSVYLLAVMIGFAMIGGVLGALDILAQRELRKTGEALPKLFLYRGWKSTKENQVATKRRLMNTFPVKDPMTGPTRDLENLFPNLVEDHLPYVIANYFKIFVRQSDISNFKTHSTMQPGIVTPELLAKLERPFIVTLGGSTTEPFLHCILQKDDGEFSFVAPGTWSEELTRQMENKKIRGTVFCGGTGSNMTSHDLLKLIRDVLEIKPDMVISYGGVNDLSYNINNDQKMYVPKWKKIDLQLPPSSSIFPNLIRYLTVSRQNRERKFSQFELYGGIKTEMNAPEYMIRNWKIMNEICKLHNIKFYAVLQPTIGSTERTRNDKKVLSRAFVRYFSDPLRKEKFLNELFYVICNFYDQAKIEVQNYDFMYDFTGIFDTQDMDMIYPHYDDWCHVSQEGNRIVAENMFKILFDEKVVDTKGASMK